MPSQLVWDDRFMRLAEHYATWSTDPSTKVGAVIAYGNRQVSQGYNGLPPGIEREGTFEDRDWKLAATIHAETNAILWAKQDLSGCTLYCTHHPCSRCMTNIVASGIRRVVYLPQPDFDWRWQDDLEKSRHIAKCAGVEVERMVGGA